MNAERPGFSPCCLWVARTASPRTVSANQLQQRRRRPLPLPASNRAPLFQMVSTGPQRSRRGQGLRRQRWPSRSQAAGPAANVRKESLGTLRIVGDSLQPFHHCFLPSLPPSPLLFLHLCFRCAKRELAETAAPRQNRAWNRPDLLYTPPRKYGVGGERSWRASSKSRHLSSEIIAEESPAGEGAEAPPPPPWIQAGRKRLSKSSPESCSQRRRSVNMSCVSPTFRTGSELPLFRGERTGRTLGQAQQSSPSVDSKECLSILCVVYTKVGRRACAPRGEPRPSFPSRSVTRRNRGRGPAAQPLTRHPGGLSHGPLTCCSWQCQPCQVLSRSTTCGGALIGAGAMGWPGQGRPREEKQK